MPRAAPVRIPPAPRQSNEEKVARPTTDRHATQDLEDLYLAERVAHALHATGYGPLRVVVVSVSARVVELLGRVPTYHLKQLAQATALAVPGAHQIHNGLDLVPRS